MSNKSALQESAMASRIYYREDNTYSKAVIKDILKMYSDEIRNSMIKGERVQITRVGTIIPEVKTHRGQKTYLPTCRGEIDSNSPYTRLRMTRTDSLKNSMNEQLIDNIDNGVLGLEKLLFDKQQLTNLRNAGYISDDIDIGEEE